MLIDDDDLPFQTHYRVCQRPGGLFCLSPAIPEDRGALWFTAYPAATVAAALNCGASRLELMAIGMLHGRTAEEWLNARIGLDRAAEAVRAVLKELDNAD